MRGAKITYSHGFDVPGAFKTVLIMISLLFASSEISLSAARASATTCLKHNANMYMHARCNLFVKLVPLAVALNLCL